MKILALDVSSSSTGWFISKVANGMIKPDPKLSLGDKLTYFRNQILSLLRKYKPTVVVIEDTFFSKNILTLKHLCFFQGVARQVCSQEGIEVEIITATQARRYCCGQQEGTFKKPEVFDYFVKKYGFKNFVFKEHNDITDAAALYWGFREQKRQTKKTNNNQKKK